MGGRRKTDRQKVARHVRTCARSRHLATLGGWYDGCCSNDSEGGVHDCGAALPADMGAAIDTEESGPGPEDRGPAAMPVLWCEASLGEEMSVG